MPPAVMLAMRPLFPRSIHHHAAYRLAPVHQVEALVDPLQWQAVGDQVVDIDPAFHIPVDDLRHVGAAAGAAEGAAAPVATGHQLEWTCADFLAGAGNADDDAGAPTLVAALQRLAHHLGVADALEGIIRAAL